MLRSVMFPALLLLPACGGSGGSTPPSSTPARLAADSLDLGPTTTTAELLVRLDDSPSSPALLEVAIELPNALTLPASNRLQPVVPLVTLDGDVTDGRFKVICGDGQNPIANLLPHGPLFRLQLVITEPRQPGSYTIRLHGLRAVASDGSPIAAETNPTEVAVIVR